MGKILKLKNVCEIGGGYAFKSSQYKTEGIPLIRIGDISDKSIDISDKSVYIDEDIDKYKKFIINKGDILIALSGATTGKFGIYEYENKALLNQRVAKIYPNELIENRYLYHYMNKLKDIIYDKAAGCAQPNISPNEIGEIDIYIPSIETQKKIVEVLDKSQSLIDKKKEQIELLDELVKSRFIEMFGDPIKNEKNWEIELLGEICDLKAGKNIKASEIHEEQTDDLYPCYGGNGLRGYVNKYSHEGNINLIGRQGALCGNVKYARGKFYATEHAVVTQPKIEINSYWLHFVLIELNLNRLSTGAAQPGLTIGKLNEVEVILPPIELQNEFAEFVTQTDSIRSKMEASLSELEDNFNSLMQKAFKGELF